MNQYWVVALLLLIGSVGFFSYHAGVTATEVACQKHDELQQANTITAEKHVIEETKDQNQITQSSEESYENDVGIITKLYGPASLPAGTNPAGGGVRRVSAAACPVQASRRYKLTLEQCDKEEAKCSALWNWARAQSAVK